MTSEDLDELLAGIAPVIQSYVSSACADLQKQVAALDARAAVPGPGVSSLMISADGRLVAHLTDGRTLDVGPVPVKDGAPGVDGRDADPARLQALESELVSVKAELAAKQADIEAFRASALGLDQVQGLIDAAGEKLITALPQPKNGQDGKSVSLDDVAPLIVSEVRAAVAALPAPKDGQSVEIADVVPAIAAEVQKAVAALPVPKDGEPGRSIDPNDVERMISARVSSWVTAAAADMPVPKDGAPGADGRSVTLDDMAPVIASEVQKAVAALPPALAGKDGDSIDPFVVETLVNTRVERAFAALVVPKDGAPGKDGTSVDVADVETLVALHVEKAVGALAPARDGKDGASVTVQDLAPLVASEVQKAAALIPAGQDGAPGADGQSVTVADVAPMVVAEVTKAVAALPVPKDGRDGVGVFGTLLDRSGHLVVTLSDGIVKDVGEVVGRSVDMGEVRRAIEEQVALIPRPKDGVDGVGFDDYEEVSDGERTITRRFTQGERVKEFTHKLPALIYRGVWVEGTAYERGDCVTFGGPMWVAKEETTVKPDYTPASAKSWILAVKEGRKGKDADPVTIEALVNKAVAKLPKPKTPEGPKW